jgi:hypothetical protein
MDVATKISPVFMHRQGYLAQSPELSRLSSASRESPKILINYIATPFSEGFRSPGACAITI